MKKLGILACMLSLATAGLYAQEKAGAGNAIDIRTLNFKQQGDSVLLTYQIIPTSKIKKWAGIGISCHIQNGDSTLLVDSLQITGKYKYIHALREHTPEVLLNQPRKGSSFPETILTFPYKEWMRAGRLHFRFFELDCCSSLAIEAGQTVSPPMKMQPIPVPAAYEPRFQYTFLTPEAKAVKDMHSSGSAFLEFPVGKSNLLVDFKNNRHELSKIHAAIDSISKNKYALITGVSLTGYASIDGASASNNRLALNRAGSVRGFIRSAYPQIASSSIRAEAGGEDWRGLQTLARELPGFEKLAPIFEMHGTEDAKERKIRLLDGGRVYRRLSEEVFPRLRRVDYTVRFTVKAFTVEEGKEQLKTAPGNLSLNELFLIANTYPAGSPEFQEVFDIAVRLYPGDTIARINASSISLIRKDQQRAAFYLKGLENDPRTLNNRALLLFAGGQAKAAMTLLEKACTGSDDNFCHNRKELSTYLEREAEREEIIRKNKANLENKDHEK